jgi:hypothetical protein
MPKSRSKSKKVRSSTVRPTKQLFVGIAIAALVIFMIFLLEFQGNKTNASSVPMEIDSASDMTVDSPFGY